MKLKIGKMSSQQVAEWLGISYGSYKKNIDKYLKKVDMYANFEKGLWWNYSKRSIYRRI